MKKIILTVFAATSLLLYSTPSFALVSVSVGMPMGHNITGETLNGTANAADKPGGYFLGVSFLSIGLGFGNQALECSTCADDFDKGSATQWYTSIGMPLIPLFDIHLSYRSITSKNINIKSSDTKLDFSGSVTGVGIAFNF